MLQADRCPDCGTVPAEWLDDEGRSAEPPPYKLEQNRCIGCETKHDAEELIPPKARKGVHFWFRRWREDDEL